MSSTSNPECHTVLSGISAYLDGDLDSAACEAIEQHCRSCSSCAAIVEGLRKTIGLCRQAGVAPLPDAVRERARASLRRLLDDPSADNGSSHS